MYLNLNNLPYVNRPAYHNVVLTGLPTHIHPTQKKNKKTLKKPKKWALSKSVGRILHNRLNFIYHMENVEMNRCVGLLLGLFNFIDERRDMFHKVQKHKVYTSFNNS